MSAVLLPDGAWHPLHGARFDAVRLEAVPLRMLIFTDPEEGQVAVPATSILGWRCIPVDERATPPADSGAPALTAESAPALPLRMPPTGVFRLDG